MLRSRPIIFALLLAVLLPAAASAEGFGFGWQYTGPATGFSLRLPLDRYLAVQPIIALSIRNHESGTAGRAAYGLRALMNLPVLGPIHPYLGAGIGRTNLFDGGQSRITQGYQGFIGLEYQLSSLRPSLEVALGRVDRSDGSSYLGTMFNLGLHYYF